MNYADRSLPQPATSSMWNLERAIVTFGPILNCGSPVLRRTQRHSLRNEKRLRLPWHVWPRDRHRSLAWP